MQQLEVIKLNIIVNSHVPVNTVMRSSFPGNIIMHVCSIKRFRSTSSYTHLETCQSEMDFIYLNCMISYTINQLCLCNKCYAIVAVGSGSVLSSIRCSPISHGGVFSHVGVTTPTDYPRKHHTAQSNAYFFCTVKITPLINTYLHWKDWDRHQING